MVDDEDDVEALFAEFGAVSSVKIITTSTQAVQRVSGLLKWMMMQQLKAIDALKTANRRKKLKSKSS
ncbi:MAG: hypothetical protein Ct9H300mP4_06240 [Gammaproteobacteria bacterium]|nr:MAG: hypothetical protein Ct9H300mP4_06240 [Gammaproteobacteria bacterium]